VRCPKSGRSTIVPVQTKVTLPDVREFQCGCCGGNLKEGSVIQVFGNNCTWGFKGNKVTGEEHSDRGLIDNENMVILADPAEWGEVVIGVVPSKIHDCYLCKKETTQKTSKHISDKVFCDNCVPKVIQRSRELQAQNPNNKSQYNYLTNWDAPKGNVLTRDGKTDIQAISLTDEQIDSAEAERKKQLAILKQKKKEGTLNTQLNSIPKPHKVNTLVKKWDQDESSSSPRESGGGRGTPPSAMKRGGPPIGMHTGPRGGFTGKVYAKPSPEYEPHEIEMNITRENQLKVTQEDLDKMELKETPKLDEKKDKEENEAPSFASVTLKPTTPNNQQST